MADFKFVISDPTARKSHQIPVGQDKAVSIVGKKIGDEFNGDIIGLSGYVLKITGGTDKDGFPMLPSLSGPGRKKILLTGVPGFHPRLKGERRRKTVRGDTISQDLMQINVKVVKKGEKSLEEIAPTKKKEEKQKEQKPEEKTKEQKVEEKPEEEKPAEKTEKKEEKKESGGEQAQSENEGNKS